MASRVKTENTTPEETLDRNGEDNSARVDNNNPDYTALEVDQLKDGIVRVLRQRSSKLNILVIGPTGVGKSSFITSMATALSGHFHEYVQAGHHGGGTRPITFYLKRFGECGLNEHDRWRYKRCTLPTLIDMAGLPNVNPDGIYEEILRTIMYGRLPETMSIARAVETLSQDGIDELRKKCPRSNPDHKIDRVLFLSSATENALSEELIRCVVNTCRPSGTSSNDKTRVIPLYGVMTMVDKVDVSSESYTALEKKFKEALGIGCSSNRFTRCINYCGDTAPDRFLVNSPRLDVPLLTFIAQLIDPYVVVDNDGELEDYSSTPVWLLSSILVALLSLLTALYFFIKQNFSKV